MAFEVSSENNHYDSCLLSALHLLLVFTVLFCLLDLIDLFHASNCPEAQSDSIPSSVSPLLPQDIYAIDPYLYIRRNLFQSIDSFYFPFTSEGNHSLTYISFFFLL